MISQGMGILSGFVDITCQILYIFCNVKLVTKENAMNTNRVCQLLGIQYPIVQAPMNWICGAELAAAVSNAGGLGTLSLNAGAKTVTRDMTVTGERLRDQIRKIKTLTHRPFAVNIAIGIGYGESLKYSRRCIEVVLEEGIPAAIVSVGSPEVYTHRLKEAGVKVIHAVSNPRHAQKAEAAGVDAVVCEGFEGGGHKDLNELTTLVLIPLVADAVKIPILAGGGIGDARGVLAALALGADGVYMGTRFMITKEADAHPALKETVVQAGEVSSLSLAEDIMLNRVLRNPFSQKYLEMKAAGASMEELIEYRDSHPLYRSAVLGEVNCEIPCGQIAGLIKNVESAEQVIQEIVKRIPIGLEELNQKLQAFFS
jgi:NAD(P)H-dependent flavin oxidoreductase YrpB (nitropropane dioxygenase family)